MPRWKIKMSDIEVWYNIVSIDNDISDLGSEFFPSEIVRRGSRIYACLIHPILTIEFRNRDSAKIFYMWISNKEHKEQRAVFIEMVEKYYREKLKKLNKFKEV